MVENRALACQNLYQERSCCLPPDRTDQEEWFVQMFRSLLDGSPCAIEVFDDEDGGKAIVVQIAECVHTNRIVSVDSLLSPSCDDVGEFWEFAFHISVASPDETFEPFSTQDRWIAANYIPDDVRPCIIEIVCRALRFLVENVRPERVYRVTKSRNPPEKASETPHFN